MEAKNMKLWESVQKTDPTFTKENKHGSGGSTSINTTYAFKCATNAFGPLGIGWGFEVLKDEIIEGAIKTYGGEKAPKTMQEKIHTLQIRFWYVLNSERGEFYQYGHTDFVGLNKWGVFTESEPQKKSLSDAIKKALSMLGFSADIYLGMYDDQTYVNEVALDKAAEKAETAVNREAEKEQEFRDWAEEQTSLFSSAQSLATLGTMYKKAMRLLAERLSHSRITQKQHDGAGRMITKAYEEAKEKLESGEK